MARRKSKAKQEEEFSRGGWLSSNGVSTWRILFNQNLTGAIIGAVVGVAVVVSLMIVIGQSVLNA